MTAARPATVAQTLDAGVSALRGGPSPRADALLLLARALRRRREWIFAHGDAAVSAAEALRFEGWCRARAQGEPLAYLLGDAGFYGRRFAVDPRVLVPRPESEHLIDEVLAYVARTARARAEILDVGTGSGALACTLAAELVRAEVWATDRCAGAIAVAGANAARLGVADRCRFFVGDLAAPVAGRRFDAVVANLPYVASQEIDPTPLRFEPRAALDGGADGLDAYRALIPRAAYSLAPGGALIVEAGQGQSGPIETLMTGAGLATHEGAKTDLAGVPRAISGRKMPG